MRILLAGATGFLGSALLRRFLAHKYQVSILVRKRSSFSRIQDLINKLDLVDYEHVGLGLNLTGYDAVINTACCYGRNGESMAELMEANVIFALNLLNSCCEYQVPFINTGSFLNPHVSGYALSKNQLEQWMDFASDRCKTVTVKLDHMYGPGDDELKFAGMLLNSFESKENELKLTKGDQTRDFIYIDDVTDLILIITQKLDVIDDRTVIEVGSQRETRVKDFVLMLRDIWERESGQVSTIKINFGALPYRENEEMRTLIGPVSIAGETWKAKMPLEEGLVNYVKWYLRDDHR